MVIRSDGQRKAMYAKIKSDLKKNSKRFVPALEAFNHVILNYPTADLIQETKIWQAK